MSTVPVRDSSQQYAAARLQLMREARLRGKPRSWVYQQTKLARRATPPDPAQSPALIVNPALATTTPAPAPTEPLPIVEPGAAIVAEELIAAGGEPLVLYAVPEELSPAPPWIVTEESAEPDCGCTLSEEHLSKCRTVPAAAPPPISGAVNEDLRSMESLLGQQEWKAAAFIGGAALETLLVELLMTREDEALRIRDVVRYRVRRQRQQLEDVWCYKPIRKWGLYGLMLVAAELGVLGPDQVTVCHRARAARNRIHGGEVIGRAEAQDVAAAVLMVATAITAAA